MGMAGAGVDLGSHPGLQQANFTVQLVADMSRLQLSFLGSFQVVLDGQPVRSFRSTKVRALLAYLAIESGRPHGREALAGLLWPDEPEEVARLNLRQSLYHLRKALGEEDRPAPPADAFFTITRQTVQFNLQSDHWLDVAELVAAVDGGQLERAAALYRGDLLKGLSVAESELFDEWLVVRRERLHRLTLEALYELTQRCQEQGAWAQTQVYAQQQLSLEPWREEAHRQLMWVLAASGQRSAALAQYELCRRSLAEELGVEPEPGTTALYEQIREGVIGQQSDFGDGATGRRGEGMISPQPPSPPVAPSHNSPRREIVGREPERAWLQRGFESALKGRGLMLCVVGEPGIGKTTLVEDFLAGLTAAGQPCALARGQCSEQLAGAEAYLPWLEALDSLLKGPGSEWGAQVMKLLAPTWYMQVAQLAPDDETAARLLKRRAASPERMKRELLTLLEELSRLQPLVLFFDDLHWADASTIDLLAYLGPKLATRRILVVTAYRPSELWLARHPFIQVKLELQGRGLCHELPLEFLSVGEIERYLAGAFPDHRFPADFPALIHAKTEGNPLFMVDLVRDLRDRKVIAEEPPGWVLAHSVPDLERELPESVRSLIERKIAQFSEADRRLLVAASVQGYEFDSSVVAQTLEARAAEVEERLEEMERVYTFVRLIGEEEFPDRTLRLRYRFVHVLYQNALYASLRPTRKAQLSGAVAQALAGYYAEQSATVASELAPLYEAAREFGPAATYYLLAAQQAAQVFANVEAATLARRGLAMLESLPETMERAQQELALQLTLGFALSVTEGYSARETEQSMARVRELCQQLGETPQLFPALWGLLVFDLVAPDFHEARPLGEQLLRVAQEAQDPLRLLGAHAGLGFALLHLGDLRAGHDHLERARALYDPQQHRAYLAVYGLDPGLYSLSDTIRSLWLLGYPEQSRSRIQEALALAEAAQDPRSLAFALHLEVVFRLFYGEVEQALERAEVCLAHCHEHGIAQEREWTKVYCGAALVKQGRVEAGMAEMRESIAALRAMRSEITFPHFLALLAEALGQAGEIETGLAAVAEALEIAHRTGDSCYEAEVYRLQGELLLQSDLRSRPLEAADCFCRALELARRQNAKAWELRAAMSLARLLQQQGQPTEARRMLAAVYGWFTEGFETADLKAAKALLDGFAGCRLG